MSLARKINDLLTGEDTLAERRGMLAAILRLASPSLVGIKIMLAIATLANASATGGALGETAAQVSAAIASKIGRGATPEATMIALAVLVLLHDGGGKAMSITQKALKFAMRPLLNERHQTGLIEGRTEGRTEGREVGRTEERQEWEEWLERQRDAGVTWVDDPPSGETPKE